MCDRGATGSLLARATQGEDDRAVMRRLVASGALLLALTALAANTSSASAYSAPDLRLRELDVGDQPVGPCLPLGGAQLASANGYERSRGSGAKLGFSMTGCS